MSDWQPIETCPAEEVVIGTCVWSGSDDHGAICGVKHDIRPNAIIDRQRGRWMVCTHWSYPPTRSPMDDVQRLGQEFDARAPEATHEN